MFSVCSFGQEGIEELPVTIYFHVNNPTDNDLYLIIKPRNEYGYFGRSQIVYLKRNDSSQTEYPIFLPDNQRPQNRYRLEIFGAESYYAINDHYSWECERIEGESYRCYHTIKDYIQVDTAAVFDSIQYRKDEQYQGPVYEQYDLEEEANYINGVNALDQEIQDSLKLELNGENARIYVQFVVETDSTLSKIEVVKSSHENQNETVVTFFKGLKFIPAIKSGVAVRSKRVIPVMINYK